MKADSSEQRGQHSSPALPDKKPWSKPQVELISKDALKSGDYPYPGHEGEPTINYTGVLFNRHYRSS